MNNKKKSKKQDNLVDVPEPILEGLSKALIDGSSFPIRCVKRGTVCDYITRLTEADGILERQNLANLSREDLLDACNTRCIGRPHWSDQKLQDSLEEWLGTMQRLKS